MEAPWWTAGVPLRWVKLILLGPGLLYKPWVRHLHSPAHISCGQVPIGQITCRTTTSLFSPRTFHSNNQATVPWLCLHIVRLWPALFHYYYFFGGTPYNTKAGNHCLRISGRIFPLLNKIRPYMFFCFLPRYRFRILWMQIFIYFFLLVDFEAHVSFHFKPHNLKAVVRCALLKCTFCALEHCNTILCEYHPNRSVFQNTDHTCFKSYFQSIGVRWELIQMNGLH